MFLFEVGVFDDVGVVIVDRWFVYFSVSWCVVLVLNM